MNNKNKTREKLLAEVKDLEDLEFTKEINDKYIDKLVEIFEFEFDTFFKISSTPKKLREAYRERYFQKAIEKPLSEVLKKQHGQHRKLSFNLLKEEVNYFEESISKSFRYPTILKLSILEDLTDLINKYEEHNFNDENVTQEEVFALYMTITTDQKELLNNGSIKDGTPEKLKTEYIRKIKNNPLYTSRTNYLFLCLIGEDIKLNQLLQKQKVRSGLLEKQILVEYVKISLKNSLGKKMVEKEASSFPYLHQQSLEEIILKIQQRSTNNYEDLTINSIKSVLKKLLDPN